MQFEVLRKTEDGLVEIREPNGRRRRVRLIVCAECERSLPDYAFVGFSANIGIPMGMTICPDCARQAYLHAREVAIRDGRIRRKENAKLAAQRRWLTMSLASPKWRDRFKIREIYAEARRKTIETGIKHQVDHFYPLQGKLCCGLHVHQNLRIMVAADNLAKSNSHPLGNSPALERTI